MQRTLDPEERYSVVANILTLYQSLLNTAQKNRRVFLLLSQIKKATLKAVGSPLPFGGSNFHV